MKYNCADVMSLGIWGWDSLRLVWACHVKYWHICIIIAEPRIVLQYAWKRGGVNLIMSLLKRESSYLVHLPMLCNMEHDVFFDINLYLFLYY